MVDEKIGKYYSDNDLNAEVLSAFFVISFHPAYAKKSSKNFMPLWTILNQIRQQQGQYGNVCDYHQNHQRGN